MFTLADLERIVAERADVTDGTSYTASLVMRGRPHCARKLGEEAVETVIAAVTGNQDELTGEAADLLYHLLVVLRSAGVPLSEVMAELERRTALSGLREKASRRSDD